MSLLLRYFITQQPRNGRIVFKLTPDKRAQSFTQDDVNNGRVLYRTKVITASADAFLFDVVAGMATLSGLEFVFDIVPCVIPLATQAAHVEEGGSVLLKAEMLNIGHSRYKTSRLEFVLVTDPTSGRIVDSERPSKKVCYFVKCLST